MGVSSSESHDLTPFYEMLTASFGVLSQNTGFYPSLDRIVETMLGPLNLGPGGGSYNKLISRLHHVLFPHEVSKCSQLGLVLTCYKEDDAPCFCQNLHISPHTFDVLVSLIRDSPCFWNNSQNEQMLVPSQLAIALFCFGHFGSAASVDAVAQWAGCSAGAVINSTCHAIKAFLLLQYHAF